MVSASPTRQLSNRDWLRIVAVGTVISLLMFLTRFLLLHYLQQIAFLDYCRAMFSVGAAYDRFGPGIHALAIAVVCGGSYWLRGVFFVALYAHAYRSDVRLLGLRIGGLIGLFTALYTGADIVLSTAFCALFGIATQLLYRPVAVE